MLGEELMAKQLPFQAKQDPLEAGRWTSLLLFAKWIPKKTGWINYGFWIFLDISGCSWGVFRELLVVFVLGHSGLSGGKGSHWCLPGVLHGHSRRFWFLVWGFFLRQDKESPKVLDLEAWRFRDVNPGPGMAFLGSSFFLWLLTGSGQLFKNVGLYENRVPPTFDGIASSRE